MSSLLKVLCRTVDISLRYLRFCKFPSQHTTPWIHFDRFGKTSPLLKVSCRIVHILLRFLRGRAYFGQVKSSDHSIHSLDSFHLARKMSPVLKVSCKIDHILLRFLREGILWSSQKCTFKKIKFFLLERGGI